ncbi:putative ankyrin repeat-containing protein [Rosellinia necatrix]|uniref:Putative ankyrin repeat-containing protein n=1 Tax=Rosellinia necatrix TaxID=77044 RepID=A0A1S7UMQ4_ROSNE|nr:putative ankyrin repeat-containing protein [Rosellinia necatrix]
MALCKKLRQMTLDEPASLATLPPEIVLNILGSLDTRDWFSLARTCRRLSIVAVAELDKYNAEEGEYYAVWYACVANKPAILLHQIAHDVTIVNRYFTSNFSNKRVDFRFGRDMTPLAVSILAARDAIVRILLANGADPNLPDRKPILGNEVLWYPINWAVIPKRKSSVPIIKLLSGHGADMNQVPKIYAERVSGYPKGLRCPPIFRLLTLEKPRFHSVHGKPTTCETFNRDLCKIQDLRLRQLIALLQSGANPNQQYDRDLVTPIFFLLTSLATYTPSFYFENRLILSHEGDAQADIINEIVVSFLDTLHRFGADIYGLGNTYVYPRPLIGDKPFDNTETPLHAACRLNDRHKPIISWFLRNGASIESCSQTKKTPFMDYCSSIFTDVDMFREFLGNRPIINSKDALGRTALHYLCANHRLWPQVKEKAVRIILDRGADPTAVDLSGHIPADDVLLPDMASSPEEDVIIMLEKAVRGREAQQKKQKDRTQGKGAKKRKGLPKHRTMATNNYENGQTSNTAGITNVRNRSRSGFAMGEIQMEDIQLGRRGISGRGGGRESHSYGDDQVQGRQDASPQDHDQSTQEGNQTTPQGGSRGRFHENIRGNRYYRSARRINLPKQTTPQTQ